jgi:hypothetical protein
MNRTITSCDFFDAHQRAGNEKGRDASYSLHVTPSRSHVESEYNGRDDGTPIVKIRAYRTRRSVRSPPENSVRWAEKILGDLCELGTRSERYRARPGCTTEL